VVTGNDTFACCSDTVQIRAASSTLRNRELLLCGRAGKVPQPARATEDPAGDWL
jgi:hypothetical protein